MRSHPGSSSTARYRIFRIAGSSSRSAILTTFEIVLVVVGYIILIASRNPWMALLSLVPLPIWTWYILRFSKIVQPAAKSALEAEDRNVSIIAENIAGVHVVKAFATEKQEVGKYDENCDAFKDARPAAHSAVRRFQSGDPLDRDGVASVALSGDRDLRHQRQDARSAIF